MGKDCPFSGALNPMSDSPTIKLDQFLKFEGLAETGGHAKLLIQTGEVSVNEEVETRRGRKLVTGDQVTCLGQTRRVALETN
jgi:ribosome-associated protein